MWGLRAETVQGALSCVAVGWEDGGHLAGRLGFGYTAEPGGWWLVWISQELALGLLLQNTYTTALAAGTESSSDI